ncbi:endoplasmic reticulum protein [Kwoniella heveanensis CBS 569]|nr:endoplasmic reticulum protein [Kwoniella heveanensis CBS 569]
MLLQSASEVLSTVWSSTQASLSVILVLVYGFFARKLDILSPEGEESASKLCVTIFLPSLLFSEIGPLASWENLQQYWIIIAYALVFQAISWIVGVIGVVVFKMPPWIVPCMVFNNATSMPLLLLSSLGKNGTLSPLVGKDSLDDVLDRGQVYLLINALVCNLTRFSFGPVMMKKHPLDIPHPWSHSESPHAIKQLVDEVRGYPEVQPYENQDEETPLLDQVKTGGKRSWRALKIVKKSVAGFMNPPMYGGLAAITFGVIPFTHRWLFEKGFLSPVSESIDKIGKLYAALQMLVIGAHLKSKKGSRPPIFTLIYLFVFRFAIMPVISTAMVYGVRKGLGDRILADPVLDFVMMIAPVGPPALTLAAIVEMSDTHEETETAVAKAIVISYALTPLISASVTAALAVVQKLY